MRKYEIMYIIRPTVEESGTKTIMDEIGKIFTDFNSKVLDTKAVGMKELAYEIEKHKKGFYVLMHVEATNEAIDEFNRKVRINEDIIRDIVILEVEK